MSRLLHERLECWTVFEREPYVTLRAIAQDVFECALGPSVDEIGWRVRQDLKDNKGNLTMETVSCVITIGKNSSTRFVAFLPVILVLVWSPNLAAVTQINRLYTHVKDELVEDCDISIFPMSVYEADSRETIRFG